MVPKVAVGVAATFVTSATFVTILSEMVTKVAVGVTATFVTFATFVTC
jgi:hypothetical protein